MPLCAAIPSPFANFFPPNVAAIACCYDSGRIRSIRTVDGLRCACSFVDWHVLFLRRCALFAVAFAIAGSSAREFSPTLVLSVVMGCFSLSTMAGIAFGGHLHLPESQTVFMPVVVVAIYCVFLVAYSIVGFWRNTSSVRILKKIRSIRLSRHLLPCAVKACRKNSLSRRGRAKFSAF